MKLTRNILEAYQWKFPDFKYYNSIIEIIELNVAKNPDICIESCKSLIEGISKTILKGLDSSYSKERDFIKHKQLQDLFKAAMIKLQEYSLLEPDFILRASSLLHLKGELRNERGDISHGKLAPKEVCSSSELANMIMQVTDGIANYILGRYFSLSSLARGEIVYEDNSDFNSMLDEAYPIDNLSYSRALFDQDQIRYEELLKEFTSNKTDS